MGTTKLTQEEIQNNKVLRQNSTFLQKLSKQKATRHVKEKNEPVLESILEDFRNDYGKTVVVESSNEILKLLNE